MNFEKVNPSTFYLLSNKKVKMSIGKIKKPAEMPRLFVKNVPA